MSITSDFSKFKKIDAHSHIGTFGSPFNIHFNADLLLKQMEEFNIEKTILCSDGPATQMKRPLLPSRLTRIRSSRSCGSTVPKENRLTMP